jgi:hypothetical protein
LVYKIKMNVPLAMHLTMPCPQTSAAALGVFLCCSCAAVPQQRKKGSRDKDGEAGDKKKKSKHAAAAAAASGAIAPHTGEVTQPSPQAAVVTGLTVPVFAFHTWQFSPG